MIELTRSYEIHSDWKVKVLGIGGAGTHAVDRLNRDGLSGVELLAANTDARALSAAFTAERIALGQSLTRGLGAGGDPELGRAAALESITAVAERLAGASLVVLLVGLGGGTGSGSAPCIAQTARAQGSHVAVFATLPFSFEGRRRREQALEALEALRREADLVICFENDRMSTVADPASGIEDAFQAVDSLLAQSVRALVSMTRRRNVLHSGLDEIAATVAGPGCTALFGYGAADGEERARAAAVRAFANPLLGFQGAVESVRSLWVYVAGGPDMRFSEVQSLMEEVSTRLTGDVRLYFGAAVDPQMEGAVSVTLLAGIPAAGLYEAGVGVQARAVEVASPFHHSPPPPVSPAQAAVYSHFSRAPEPPRAPEPIAFEQPVLEPLHDFPTELEPAPEPAPGDWRQPSWEQSPEEPSPEPPLHHQSEPESAPLPARGVPIPPFELTKERRREASAPAVERPFSAPAESAPQPVSVPVAQQTEPVWEPVLPLEEETPLPVVPDPQPVASVRPSYQEAEHEAPEVQNPPQEPAGRKAKENVQEQMRFEPVNRGRFEKTDPTIVDGEDLDVPTFMRQGVSLEP
jgi:cell division protein FtsZ